jgi:hypothetical protein
MSLVDFSNSPVENLILPVSSPDSLRQETSGGLNVSGDRLRSASKSTDEIVHLWNEAHPEDMISFAAEPEPSPSRLPVRCM